ncbi:SDR family oxidoreductase [Kocuria marina]|uniref:SDR family oxidoreductase n=1 Tax=Kocuria marina TaxID=223184 RepID=UPI00209FAD30
MTAPTDVTDYEQVEALTRRAVERFGRIDVLINNAATTYFAPFQEVPLADIQRILEIDVMDNVHGVRVALPILRKPGTGMLVNVFSSVGAAPRSTRTPTAYPRPRSGPYPRACARSCSSTPSAG